MPFGFHFNSRHMAPSEVITDLLQNKGENIIVVAAIVKSQTRMTETILLKALKRLICYQPALRMRISTETSMWKKVPAKRFSEMSKVDRSVTISRGGRRNSWLEVVEEELSNPIASDKGPLWRMKYTEFTNEERTGKVGTSIFDSEANTLQIGSSISFQIDKSIERFKIIHQEEESQEHEGVLIFKIHQVIADEVSLFDLFHQQFIPILQDVINRKKSKKFAFSLHMIPPAEEAFDVKRELSWRQKRKLRRSTSSRREKSVSKTQPTNPSSINVIGTIGATSDFPVRACILPFVLMPNVSKAFYQLCQEHRVSFLSAFIVASSSALGIHTFAAGSAFSEDIKCNFPIDLRQFSILGSPYTLGMWKAVGQLPMKSFHFPLSCEKFWKLCKRTDNDLKAEMQKPCSYFKLQKKALRTLPKLQDLSVFTELNNADLEVSVVDSSSLQECRDLDHSMTAASGMVDKKLGKIQKASKSLEERVTLEEFYLTKSMSDISSVPISVTACMYQSRIMCTVTYNSKDIQRSFATGLADVLINVINWAAAGLSEEKKKGTLELRKKGLKYFATLPPYKRASLSQKFSQDKK